MAAAAAAAVIKCFVFIYIYIYLCCKNGFEFEAGEVFILRLKGSCKSFKLMFLTQSLSQSLLLWVILTMFVFIGIIV